MPRRLQSRSHRSKNPPRRSSLRQLRLSLRPIRDLVERLPELVGPPISISVQPALTAHRGKLLSKQLDRGTPVHAASFIRAREIVLETALLGRRRMLRLIVVHEIFHFVWARLGNVKRREFADLVARESSSGARGALGESSGAKKSSGDWRDYVCESFCDTAAWLYSGVKRDPAFTLGERWRRLRRAWFEVTFASCRKC